MSPDYAQAFDAGQRQAFMDRIAGTRQPRPTRLQCEADRGWWDGYTPRNAAWWVAQPLVSRERIEAAPNAPEFNPDQPPGSYSKAGLRAAPQQLNPPDQRDVQRLLVDQRDREAA